MLAQAHKAADPAYPELQRSALCAEELGRGNGTQAQNVRGDEIRFEFESLMRKPRSGDGRVLKLPGGRESTALSRVAIPTTSSLGRVRL